MINKNRKFTRRSLLRGAIQGSTVVMGLPILESFLNSICGMRQLDGRPADDVENGSRVRRATAREDIRVFDDEVSALRHTHAEFVRSSAPRRLPNFFEGVIGKRGVVKPL